MAVGQMVFDYEGSMKFREYQQKARMTRLPTADEQYCRLNLAGEVGEFLGKIAKYIRDGGDFYAFKAQAEKEAGDILWQLAACLDDLGIDMEDAARNNIIKLLERQAKSTLQGSGDDR